MQYVKWMIGKIKEKKVRAFCVFLFALSLSGLFLIARGPHISNQLKRIILPELSSATGRQVMAQRIYVNIFPLFVEAREVKIFDRGNEILRVPKVKAYLGLSRILKGELVLKRLIIGEPSIRSDNAQVEDIIGKIKEYQKIERKAPLKVVVEAITLNAGTFIFGYGDMSFSGNGFHVETILTPPANSASSRTTIPRISFAVKNLATKIKGWPDLKGEIKGVMAVKDDAIEVKGLQVGFFGSMIHASGAYEKERGDIRVRLGLLVESFKRIFGLKQRGEGEISANGTMRIFGDDLMNSSVDMELKGDFYIETLMEFLKVKEKIEGLVTFTGNLEGPLKGLRGTAKARLKKGNLFNVDIDELTSSLTYREGRLIFGDGRGSLYHGRAEADAVVAISGPAYYALHVKFEDIDSSGAFKLIRWDPGIPQGKVKGGLSTEGEAFNPSGSFEYVSTAEGKDVLGRVKRVKGSFKLIRDLLTLSDTEVNTPKSFFRVNGNVNIESSALSLKTEIKTDDVRDITSPFLEELTGSGSASATVTGKSADPLISGSASLHAVSFDGYYFGEMAGNADYRKNLLEVKELSVTDASRSAERLTATIRGSIKFPFAKELFDFKTPHYALSVSVKNSDLEGIMKMVYKKPVQAYPKGSLNADLNITGPGPTIPSLKGIVKVNALTLGDLSIDSVSSSFSYDYKDLLLNNVIAIKGNSAMTAEGSLSHEGKFAFRASGSKVFLRDVALKTLPFDAYLTFRAEGRGTLESPEIDMDGTFHSGRFKDVELGDGKLKASLRGRALLLNARLFKERVSLSGKADLKGDLPWMAHLDVLPGRYDFLIGAFLKEIPEDLLINMKGYADMSGDRNHFAAKAVVNQLNMTIYGNSFSNDADMRFDIKDRRLSISPFTLRSGSIFLKMSGNVEIGKEYDLVVEGKSAMLPLKLLSKKIDVVRGDARYAFSIAGKWDNPRINGDLQITDGLFSLKDTPYRVNSIGGSIFMDGDKIVVQRLTGRVGGGDVSVSGVAYMHAFKVSRFYIDAVMDNIGLEISRDLTANFSGSLLYKGTLDSQTLSGDVRLNRAKYRERVEWKSWLLKTKTTERPRGEIGALDKIALNVKVAGSDNIVIDNNIARAALKVDLLLRGTLSRPVLFGRIETQTGTVYFRNNEFRIMHASADFADPRRINPVMTIIAETSIKGYNIRMNLEGQVDRFNLSLISDPPLEEVDILGLLTVGKFGKELQGIEGGIGAGAATSFLTGKFQDAVEERLKNITGLDRVEFDPYVSKTTGSVNPRVTVSKRLVGERLFVTYSSAVGSTETNALKVEYLLGRNVSLIGVRDEKGGLGGDIKFRFEFK